MWCWCIEKDFGEYEVATLEVQNLNEILKTNKDYKFLS